MENEMEYNEDNFEGEDNFDFDSYLFEIDFMTVMFMLDDHKMTREKAREKAIQWHREARE